MLRAEANSPPWFVRFVTGPLAKALQAIEQPGQPVQLPQYATVSALPLAADFMACTAYVAAITMTVFSDGTIWRRSDTGAAA